MNNKESRARLSNFEFLRLLCMFMILNLHSFHGYQYGGGVFQALDFFRESTSICAVDCFVLISGYFGIKWKFRSFFNLVFQIFFWSIMVYLFAVGINAVNWQLKDFLTRFMCLKSSWGFVTSYIILYFAAPLLNSFSDAQKPRILLTYIVVLFLVINFVSMPSHSFFTYALIYLIGRYLQKVGVANLKCKAGVAYLITTTIIFLLVYGLLYNTFHITDEKAVNKLPIGIIGYSYSSPLVILQSVFLFLFFAQKTFYNRIVNWCATSCFAIFLIHMHPTIKDIGYYSYTAELYNNSVINHIITLIVLMLSVFFGCIFLDKIRMAVSDSCLNLIYYLKKLLPVRWQQFENYISNSFSQITSLSRGVCNDNKVN